MLRTYTTLETCTHLAWLPMHGEKHNETNITKEKAESVIDSEIGEVQIEVQVIVLSIVRAAFRGFFRGLARV